jgi:8-oxo-dGTP pyrophosphatase MutT (NUDIX family)
VFKGVLFDVYQWEQTLYDGSITTFEKLKRKDSAVVIPVLADGRLLIVEDEQPGRSMKLTFPGGQIEEGETPEVTAHREFLEETGYRAKELILYKAKQPTSKIEWAIYTFIARGCEKVQEPMTDPGEKITTRVITLDEAFEIIATPDFQNREIVVDFLSAKFNKEARTHLEVLLVGA